MNLNEIKPVGPHIEGFIRFASEGTGDNRKQLGHFEVLSRVHELADNGDYRLAKHPIMDKIAKKEEGEPSSLKVIPIKLMFDSVENNISARYEAYDKDIGRLVCSGDGRSATRKDLSTGQASNHNCPGPDVCNYANSQGVSCQLNVRMKVQLDEQDDPFSVFEFQSGGINTYRTLSSKLELIRAGFGGKLRKVPLQLTIWEKSSPLSLYEPFYCADLKLRDGADLKSVKEAMMTKDPADVLDVEMMETAATGMRANVEPLMDDSSVIITYTPRVKVHATRQGDVQARGSAAAMTGLAGVVAAARETVLTADDGVITSDQSLKVDAAGAQTGENPPLPPTEHSSVPENISETVGHSAPAILVELGERPPTVL